jgi:hypothetical protein
LLSRDGYREKEMNTWKQVFDAGGFPVAILFRWKKRKPPEGGFLVNHDLREESDGSG